MRRAVLKKSLVPFALLLIVLTVSVCQAETKSLTIVHTNDLHSHFLGFAPNIDFTWETTGDDATKGGWARLAGVIKGVRQDRSNPVLVLDAGDFMMGSLFHLLSREQAFELRLMQAMGYDAVSLGNHEFDLTPDGLARILNAAKANGNMPPLVLANARFSQESDKDDSLKAAFDEGLVKPYVVIEKSGLKIGLFGLLGHDAMEVAPFASPVEFDDPVATAKRIVEQLRNKEKADLIICLSHSGLRENREKSEDVILAKEVPDIDIIISGHTHTRLEKPIIEGKTIIVQTGAYGVAAGILDVQLEDGQAQLEKYVLTDLDDTIAGDPEIAKAISEFEKMVESQVLAPFQLGFRETLAHTDFDLTIRAEESNLGNLIADALRWSVNKYESDPHDPTSQVTLAVISNGVIRDDILPGKTGRIAVCDAFRAIPLGIGWDDTMGYPMVSFYITAAELKKTFEILTTIYPMKGWDYFLQYSGAKITYNPNRVLFDRVTGIWLGDEENGYQKLDYSESNPGLYRVTADIYNSTFLKIIGNFTSNILEIIPKDREGRPISDLGTVRVDMKPNQEGIQELKEWWSVLEYIKSLPDIDGDGVPDIPEKYKAALGRQNVEPSWNPYHLLRGGNYLTWGAFGIVVVILLVILFGVRFVVRRRRKRK
jgi:5'-nucleotidase/UDP-sugar diphosphatase